MAVRARRRAEDMMVQIDLSQDTMRTEGMHYISSFHVRTDCYVNQASYLDTMRPWALMNYSTRDELHRKSIRIDGSPQGNGDAVQRPRKGRYLRVISG